MWDRRLFLLAYTCSGLAGLVYEVSWTRLLTRYMGHTTAAASTVVAAFMGGLAIGSALGGRAAPRLRPRHALYAYAGLEVVVVLTALAMPIALSNLNSLLSWAYRDGTSGAAFSLVRVVCCLAVLLPPAVALGATFPVAVRWFLSTADHPGGAGGRMYAVNTTGAAVGALGAGFLLIPAIGLSGTMMVGVVASALTIGIVLAIARTADGDADGTTTSVAAVPRPGRSHRGRRAVSAGHELSEADVKPWLAGAVLALTGFATFIFEIAWTRVFSMIVGPSTYAFAATVTAFIAGIAAGSFVGSALAARTRRPALALAVALGLASMAAGWAASFVGGSLPAIVLRDLVASPTDDLLLRHSILVAALVVPTAVALGITFPLALELAGSRGQPAAARVGTMYAVNTLAAVCGALSSGFFLIPAAGLQNTIRFATASLLVGSVIVVARGRLSMRERAAVLVPAGAAAAILAWSQPWDRELLASGMYKYAQRLRTDGDLESALKAGTLLYYREGATATVSVRRLTGDLSLAIDGKVDASTSGDMITQKALAHLPLLLHPNPRRVCIVGLGSGVTLASALLHPVAAVDVVEISPEVVEASGWFAAQNHKALDDPRTRLILGDGRSHLSLSSRKYDVIVSEPSNPWMAGVAALFTKEFFTSVRRRLAPGGIICQWAHTYDISADDLRSIVATFASVFPDGTMWLVADGDLLLVGSTEPLESSLDNIAAGWQRPGVAADLNQVSMMEPFALWSMFVGGPEQLAIYARGAALQTDDRSALEFSGPHSLNSEAAGENVSTLRRLLDPAKRPPTIARAFAAAGAREWRNRATMLLKAGAYGAAYEDFVTALTLQPTDADALAGLVRAAVAAHREADAENLLKSAASTHTQAPALLIALSKLYAAGGVSDRAIEVARRACDIAPFDPAAWEHLASLYADAADAARLAPVVELLQTRFPLRPRSRYYAAALQFLREQLPAALQLAKQAVELDPNDAAAHNLVGAIHANLGQTSDARMAFSAALRLDPRDVATYTNLAMLELASGNRPAAAELFAEALSLDPASASARQGLAQAQMR